MFNHKKQILTEQSYEESEDNFEREARKLVRKFQTLISKKCKLGFFAGFKEAERLAVGLCRLKLAERYYSELLTLVKKYEKMCKTKQCKARYLLDEEKIKSDLRRVRAAIDATEDKIKSMRKKK